MLTKPTTRDLGTDLHCVQGDSRFLARIFARTKRKHANKKHFTEAVLSSNFHARPSSHRKARPHNYTFFAAPSLKQSDFAMAVQRVLIVTYFPVVPEWKARKM